MPLYLRALAIWQSVLPADDRRLAPIYYKLGTLRKVRKAYRDAEQFYGQALQIVEKHWEPTHPYAEKCRCAYLEAKELR